MTGSEHALLITHAARWAEDKRRPLDAELLETVLRLVSTYDERSAQAWPKGSATNLVLHRWPAHGPALPDGAALADTLDTYWRFLRATGRMTSTSAAPGDLSKELRRALPRMAEATEDRSNWSQGRVMKDFAESIGLSFEGAATREELQGRLDQVMTAWNELPTEERFRLMPDASPKSAAGATATALMNSLGPGGLDDDDDPTSAYPHYRRGIRAVAAQEARVSGFRRRIDALVDWVGEGKAVTRLGVLRPALAREAYLALDLATWERRREQVMGLRSAQRSLSPEAMAEYAAAMAESIARAGDCIALDRLWWAATAADLIEVRSTTARSARHLPDGGRDDDEQALILGLTLVTALVERFNGDDLTALASILLRAMIAPDGEIDLAAVREEHWRARPYAALVTDEPGSEEFWRDVAAYDITRCVAMFDDTGIWLRRGDALAITDFGREFAVIVTAMADEAEDEDGQE